MQANTLTLPVDTTNNGTTTNRNYNRYREEPEKTEYRGPDHAGIVQDTLTITRKSPTRNGNFLGAYRTKAQFAQSYDVIGLDGTTQKGINATISIEVVAPLGLTDAQLKELRQRALALLDNDTVMDALNRHGEI